MSDALTTPEAVAILSLLMVGADSEVRVEELSSMISNPFFAEHVTDKIGPHKEFIKKYNGIKKAIGNEAMEANAIAALKGAFPALQVKTIALMTFIAEADGTVEKQESELIDRVMQALSVATKDVDPEKKKMQETMEAQAEAKAENDKKETKPKAEPEGAPETEPESEPESEPAKDDAEEAPAEEEKPEEKTE
ncbi:TerB family tellurite resistance protein [Pseudodesulfovibrio sp.]|nr:TerB family tellurite resistance protein [Pseudodesulfovibrio sp.]